MIRVLNSAALVLMLGVGLHVPRSFILLYGFAAITLVLVHRGQQSYSQEYKPFFRYYQLLGTLLLALFSITYVAGMLFWQLWTLPVNAQDSVNALLLPGLMFAVGSQAAAMQPSWSTRILLAYALGGLAYGLAALAVSRIPWWNIAQIFPSTLDVAWGNVAEVNVRSVEQTAYPALLFLAPAVLLLLDRASQNRRRLGAILIVLCALGAHVVWSLNGRLGWVALLLSFVPVLALVGFRSGSLLPRLWRRLVPIALLAVVGLALGWRWFQGAGRSGYGIWAQGFCDERFSLFAAMLPRLHEAPLGGRSLVVTFPDCLNHSTVLMLSEKGGTHVMAHNVILDVYYSVGLVPSLLLLAVLLPGLVAIIRSFLRAWPVCGWQVVLRWGWLCFLVLQWLFQSLIYSDGLLYYFSFFVLGLLAFQVPDSAATVGPVPVGPRVAQDVCA